MGRVEKDDRTARLQRDVRRGGVEYRLNEHTP